METHKLCDCFLIIECSHVASRSILITTYTNAHLYYLIIIIYVQNNNQRTPSNEAVTESIYSYDNIETVYNTR
jgi:hypothetical protein